MLRSRKPKPTTNLCSSTSVPRPLEADAFGWKPSRTAMKRLLHLSTTTSSLSKHTSKNTLLISIVLTLRGHRL
jgi:hypothetical protein